ncbi:MAG: FAD binding domain-containing protein [Firmicutes bacterium]|nr:FAD binding domain-containing protein [Alicyclobacillaceae bacterium]MCL6497540.1 FAD binding domain-containing protein [Bacillota bacterium]
MKPAPFGWIRAHSVAEAVAALREHPEAKVIAGGQSLVPLLNFRLSRPSHLVDINPLETSLNQVEWSGSALTLGALVRHQRLAEHPVVRERVPVLSRAASHIGHWAIRVRGTLGGSISHADPAAELPAAMVALNAVLVAQSADGTREIPASEFFQGYYTTALQADELLTAVRIPAPEGRWGFAEVARRLGDFALAGAFVQRGSRVAVTWFGVAGAPVRVELTEVPADAREREVAWRQALTTAVGSDLEVAKVAQAVAVAEKAWSEAQ